MSKIFSVRMWVTLCMVWTYCAILLKVAETACALMLSKGGFSAGEKLAIYVIGALSGSVIGTIIGYFFRSDRQVKQ